MPTTIFDTPYKEPEAEHDPQAAEAAELAAQSDMEQRQLERCARWKQESSAARSRHEQRWAKNLRLSKGIFSDEEMSRSKVRQRSKLFFRKIWATNWRILASFYGAFLREPDTFRIEGRDGFDVYKAQILQTIMEYRRDKMMREDSLFKKFLWAFQDILDLGWSVAKLHWVYQPELGKDGPAFTVYPLEQVYADFSAGTEEQMRYLGFENFMSYEQLEENGYQNLDKVEACGMPFNQVRAARFYGQNDPLQNPSDKEYPSPGRYDDGETKEGTGKLYRAIEWFYLEKGRIMMMVENEGKAILKPAAPSPYGKCLPAIFGDCLTRAHQLVGEGFPEPLEGPQESYNGNMNMRKDNVALALNKGTIVSRFGNVDLQSLVNSRPGGVTLADDVNAVKEREITDVTASSYNEAATDEAMMQEMSGVTPSKNGMGQEQKATVAQINLSEGNAKIDLYIAIVGETFVRSFYSKLAYFIQLFETDEKVFRVAHTTWAQANMDQATGQPQMYPTDPYDLDFEADLIVNVGAISRDNEVKNILLAMDRATMANQSLLALLTSGAPIPPEGIRFFNTTAFMETLLPKIGQKNVQDYFFMVQPPPLPPQGGQDPAGRGRAEPQIGATGMLNDMNDLQAGGMGGF